MLALGALADKGRTPPGASPEQEVTRVGRLGAVMGFGVVLALYVWIFFFSR
jgi:hypothetical protein